MKDAVFPFEIWHKDVQGRAGTTRGELVWSKSQEGAALKSETMQKAHAVGGSARDLRVQRIPLTLARQYEAESGDATAWLDKHIAEQEEQKATLNKLAGGDAARLCEEIGECDEQHKRAQFDANRGHWHED